jgi:hypothetical protein
LNESFPGSSVEERPAGNGGEAGGSTPPRGATYQYIVVRKELSGGALLAQVAHAAGESVQTPLPIDTRVVVLQATKGELSLLTADLMAGGVEHKAILETDGPLAGSITAVGLVTTDREKLRPILRDLKLWRAKP